MMPLHIVECFSPEAFAQVRIQDHPLHRVKPSVIRVLRQKTVLAIGDDASIDTVVAENRRHTLCRVFECLHMALELIEFVYLKRSYREIPSARIPKPRRESFEL